MELAAAPAASLAMDEIIENTLTRPPGNPWREIPLGYRLLERQCQVLLESGWLVVLESTFTYVDENGASEFHEAEIDGLVALASDRDIPYLVIQLWVDEETALRRAAETRRLPPQIVAETVRVHDDIDLPDPVLRLIGVDETPGGLARRIVAELNDLG